MEKGKTGQKKKGLDKPQTTFLREFSSGGVVYKEIGSKTLWLVTKSTSSPIFPKSFWRLPKGWIDDDENGKDPGPLASGERKATQKDLEKAAIREVSEEGGVKASIRQKIGTINYFFTIENKRILKFVTFFLMEWIKNTAQGPGTETSEIAWLDKNDAVKILKSSGEKKILKKASEMLSQGKLF